MKLFRLKFILLGMFLCVCNALSMNCGTEYDDAASNAYLSDVVVVGRVSQRLPLGYEKYNATIRIRGKRSIFKGDAILKKGSSRRRSSDMITIGVFQDVPEGGAHSPGVGDCVYTLSRDTQYLFFLNSSAPKKYFTVTAVPISEQLKKEFKRAKKDIKKVLCKKNKCVTPPILDSRRGMKDRSVQFGKTLELNCKLKKRTFPITKFIWFKDDVDITHRSSKGFSIKDSKKGSVLRIRKTSLSDNGTYRCVAKNVGGEIRQQAVITITGVNAPQAGSGSMKDKRQKFRGTLKLNCKIKKGALPKAEFFWYKDGHLITSGQKKGLVIRNRATQSRLRKKPFLQSDAGVYLCKAKNDYGEINQTSKVTVIDAPPRISPCGERDKHWCMNNGTCMMYVELKQKYCTCLHGYGGDRCMELIFPGKSMEEKLAQDRNLVIIGIISGILLFIGICVASYFLAKRRREQFYRRRRQRNNGNIEDNIPQIYRPLIGCDEIDGLKKQMTGFGVPKGTQTMETCFVGNDNTDLHLYINPMTGYTKTKNERKTAVSLESNPRPTYNGSNESLDKNKHPEHPESNSDNNNKSDPGSKRNSINNSASDGGPSEIFKLMNDLNPKKKSGGADNPRNTGASKPNIPTAGSPTAANPPAFNLDTDSEDEVLNDVTPLTPLHISEEEDNNADFPKIKHVKTSNVHAGNNPAKKINDPPRGSNYSKDEMKSKQLPPAKQQPPQSSQPKQQPPPKQQQPPPNQQQPFKQQHQQKQHPSQPRQQQLPPQSRPHPHDPRKQHPSKHHEHHPKAHAPAQPNQASKQQYPPKQEHASKPPNPNKPDYSHRQQHPPRQQQQQQQKAPRQPRSDGKTGNQNEARASPGDKLYASTSSSGYSDSDSSTTTEGCDSPETAFKNSQDLSEQAPVQETATNWNERGSPELRQPKASSKYKPPPDIGVSRDQYYSTSGGASPGRKGAGTRDYGRNYRQSR